LNGSVLTDGIKHEYSTWLISHERDIINNPWGEIIASFYTRLSIYLLKFALLYQVSMNDGNSDFDYQIKPIALDYAINLISSLKDSLKYLFEFEITTDGWYAKKRLKIIKIIKNNGGSVSRRRLQQNAHESANHFNQFLESMTQEETIFIDEHNNVVLAENR
jgi:hypothetical protein